MKYITQSRPSTPFVALMRFAIDHSSTQGRRLSRSPGASTVGSGALS
jgi:hypothetical protein